MQKLRLTLASISYITFLTLVLFLLDTSALSLGTLFIVSLGFGFYILAAWREWQNYSSEANKRVVIPEFKLEKAKFYQLGMLMDGDFTNQDLLATLIFYTLHKPQQPDEIEQIIMNSASAHTIATLDRMLQGGDQTEEELNNNIAKKLKHQIYAPIYDSMKAQEYFRYNPNHYNSFALGLMLLAPLLFLGVSLMGNLTLAFAAMLALLTVGASVWGLIWLNFENHAKTNDIKTRALGYKMYLATVEWYTVEKDEKALEKHLPYFLLFNLKQEKYSELVNHVLRKLQLG